MLLEWNLTLPDSTVNQPWRSNEALSQVLLQGHRVLFGSSTHWSLDSGNGAWLNLADPLNPGTDSRVHPPYVDHCARYKNRRHINSYNPLSGEPDAQRYLILGGKVHISGEMTDAVTLDGMLWPRAAAAAEVLWRGPGAHVSEDTARMLAELSERLVLRGIMTSMVQME
ncbi:glycoside hydrolase family 20 protein [Zopfia rhizophila CBS 207.26]|uniref:beta-N-acetylhexosaminidase n=1 Tax=Zopfia rhizophila CBS 207.26 TaxID=1314779 RepID=A0A6A6ESJ1_9PEZI|nr:glycoside hydrolase family 20 protein [Zopfia rhizophila CBS 207.26]